MHSLVAQKEKQAFPHLQSTQNFFIHVNCFTIVVMIFRVGYQFFFYRGDSMYTQRKEWLEIAEKHKHSN